MIFLISFFVDPAAYTIWQQARFERGSSKSCCTLSDANTRSSDRDLCQAQ